MGFCSAFMYEMCHSKIIAFGRLTRIQSTWQQLTQVQGKRVLETKELAQL